MMLKICIGNFRLFKELSRKFYDIGSLMIASVKFISASNCLPNSKTQFCK